MAGSLEFDFLVEIELGEFILLIFGKFLFLIGVDLGDGEILVLEELNFVRLINNRSNELLLDGQFPQQILFLQSESCILLGECYIVLKDILVSLAQLVDSLLEEGDFCLVEEVSLLKLIVIRTDLLVVLKYFESLAFDLLLLHLLIPDVLPAAFEVLNRLIEFQIALLLLLLQPINDGLEDLIIVEGMLQFLPFLGEQSQEVGVFLFEGLHDFAEFATVLFGEDEQYSADAADGVLSQFGCHLLFVHVFIEEVFLQLVENYYAVIVFRGNHLLYLLFSGFKSPKTCLRSC